MDGVNNRREPRIRSRGIVHLVMDEHPPVPATIFDVSVSGLGVDIAVHLPPGQPVTIDGINLAASAIVRYCRAHGSKFRAGLELLPPQS